MNPNPAMTPEQEASLLPEAAPPEHYELPRKLGEGIHCVEGEWQQTAFRRRMTLLEYGDHQLALHSPIRMRESDVDALVQLGNVDLILMPNVFHGSEVPWYAKRFPGAKVLIPAMARARFIKSNMAFLGEARSASIGTLESDWPEGIERSLVRVLTRGTRISESVFLHPRSRTLVLTDLAFNMKATDFRGFERTLMGWNEILDRFGPSRIFRWGFLADPAAFADSLRQILEHDFDRIVVNHGTIVEAGGKQLMRAAFARWLGV